MINIYSNTIEVEGLILEIDQLCNIENEKKQYGAICTAIRQQSGMKRAEFARWLGVPYRTFQDWELGNTKIPEYVLRLIAYKVKIENMLKEGRLIHNVPSSGSKKDKT